MKDKIDYLLVNSVDNYLYTTKLSKYAELNQDLYLWVIESSKLKEYYYDTNGDYIANVTRFLVEGKKLDRAPLPPLNLILQSFDIGYWSSSSNSDIAKYTDINFNFPSATENRKFNLKIGKITDNTILTKIKNNDYTGITDLLSYAKNNSGVYSKQLTTTSTAYFRSDDTLFDGRRLLENKAYYYIYVDFDNENGKYYPIEGVTLGQAWFSSSTDTWYLLAYTSSDFNWDNLSPTYTPSKRNSDDSTVAPGILPKTGTNVVIMIFMFFTISIVAIICYKKYIKYKNI